MRIVLFVLILLFSSSAYAISLEDGLRIKLNNALNNSIKKDPHKIAVEFIQLYLETLKYKELLLLSVKNAKKNANALLEAKIKVEITSKKDGDFEEISKLFFIANNQKILDEINYIQSKKQLSNALHVKVHDVKLPLIQKIPKSLEKTLEQTQEDHLDTKTDEREKIINYYKHRVASYNLLATNPKFISDILSKNNLPENMYDKANKILKFHLKDQTKKHKQVKKIPKIKTTKMKKKTLFCFKVNTDILNVRKKHSQKSKIVHRYKKDDKICASKQTFNWIKTEHGWVSKDYLIRIKSELSI